jgi:hypothetical protein
MATFAKFIMLDSGRPIHINPMFVEQVRDTDQPGTTAIYLTGRAQPVAIEAKIEAVMKQLVGAPPSPLKLVSTTPRPVPAPAKAAQVKRASR